MNWIGDPDADVKGKLNSLVLPGLVFDLAEIWAE